MEIRTVSGFSVMLYLCYHSPVQDAWDARDAANIRLVSYLPEIPFQVHNMNITAFG